MAWKCEICGAVHDDAPDCFGIEAPWRELVADDEFEGRVELNKDQCVVDGNKFFIRGHIEIPILEYRNPLAFSVWSSLSEQSFLRMNDRWNETDREKDAPYFGWLSSSIWVYHDTINLKLSVRSHRPGQTPLFYVTDDEHPLAIDQRNGISIERWHRLAHDLMH